MITAMSAGLDNSSVATKRSPAEKGVGGRWRTDTNERGARDDLERCQNVSLRGAA